MAAGPSLRRGGRRLAARLIQIRPGKASGYELSRLTYNHDTMLVCSSDIDKKGGYDHRRGMPGRMLRSISSASSTAAATKLASVVATHLRNPSAAWVTPAKNVAVKASRVYSS
uniref:Uncharacterized protein n=1 Tax=Oryza rufipogon TaxID=4529 RepID=A0A0E0NQY8_ORYRU